MSTFVGAERLFTPDDLATFVLRDDILPTKTDVLLYMLSGSRNSNKKDVHQTAKKVIKIWEAADCCPLALTPAKRIVEKLKVDYKFFLNNYNDGTKRSKVKKKKLEVDSSEPPSKKDKVTVKISQKLPQMSSTRKCTKILLLMSKAGSNGAILAKLAHLAQF